MRSILLALVLSVVLVPPAPAGDIRRFEDAALHAIQFADQAEGWAVGDEGVVWHTIDSGKTWERQKSGVRASLRGLHFLNPYVGFIVGREELPDGGSMGVILFTHDGGLTWQRSSRNIMPGLEHVRFVDPKVGYVVGDGVDQFPTGVFATRDGGRSWQPIPGPRCPGWQAAHFSDAANGVLVGRWNRLATLKGGTLGAADVDTLGGRNLQGLLVQGKQAFAVGQGGLILKSETAGDRWGFVEPKLPVEVRACWDFHAIHGQGDHLWIAGRPGSAVLHSADHGVTWDVQRTGQPIPLHGIYFHDEQQGWAVGDLGTILTTTNGGKKWEVQRRGGMSAALLFVHARSSELPADTLALLGGQEGYLATGLCVLAPDPATAALGRSSMPQRWSAAVNESGGAAAEMLWQFPMPQHLDGLDRPGLMRHWDRLHGDHAAEQLVRQMVLALRMWKPVVLVSDHPDPVVTNCPAEALAAEALHEAFRRAADPASFPEQIQLLGLEPWSVGKFYSLWHNRQAAQVVYDTTQISNRLEMSFRDFASPAAALLTDRVPPLPNARCYRLLEARIEGAAAQRDLMAGTNLGYGGTARREAAPAMEPNPELIRAAEKRRTLEALAEVGAGAMLDPNKLLAQLGPTFDGMPDEQACAAAYALGTHFARQGQWLLAREVFLLMVDTFPAHPQSAEAYRWLVRYSSSSEARRRQELGQFLVVENLTFQRSNEKPHAEGVNFKIESKSTTQNEVVDGTISHLRDLTQTRAWYEGALRIGERLERFGPLYATDPGLRFCLNSARRNLDKLDEATEGYTRFRDGHNPGPWRDAAAAELWLSYRSGNCPKATANCRQTTHHPYLDGKLDDPCWQSQKPIVLRSAAGDTAKDYPTEAWLAFDNEFLYLALHCSHPADRHATPVKVRRRDDNLRGHDRVYLMLDLDRDYATYYRMQIDQRGCLCEDCWGDQSWNPRWFVAHKSDATSWTIEAAIPLTELTGDRMTIGKAWACNLVRVLPGRGLQALSLPADVEPRPEGMGLLLFSPEAPPRAPQPERPVAQGQRGAATP